MGEDTTVLREQIKNSLKDAMRAKEALAVSTLRLILAALKDRDIAARGKGNEAGIADDDILGMLQGMVRQREESIALYQRGGRSELAAQEEQEIGIIRQFLPTQMTGEVMRDAIEEAIRELGAMGLKDMGKVMGDLRRRYPGRMDFGQASPIVKSLLG